MSAAVWYEYSHNGAKLWFWRDEQCEEPMGPFCSRDEAVADHKRCRTTGLGQGIRDPKPADQ